MDLDDTVCFCFHVSYRKLRNYARHHKPPVASMMSECLGAGTGCGWCCKIIVKIWEQHRGGGTTGALPVPDERVMRPAAEIEALAPNTEAERKAERERYWLEKYGKTPGEGPPEK